MPTRKVLVTLDIDNYAPAIKSLTFPLMRYYARKIGATFHVIRERKFPEWPIAVEKFQVRDVAEEAGAEWAIFFDADALVHPETPDWTSYLERDTVAHNGSDFAGIRWRPHEYFLRDGRNIGCCNWCAVASHWCLRDFWHPPLGLAPEQVLEQVYPTVPERNTGLIDAAHLVDDYLMSLNVARFGLKFTTLMAVQKMLGLDGMMFHYHEYLYSVEQKVERMVKVLWGDPARTINGEKDRGWDLPASILPR